MLWWAWQLVHLSSQAIFRLQGDTVLTCTPSNPPTFPAQPTFLTPQARRWLSRSLASTVPRVFSITVLAGARICAAGGRMKHPMGWDRHQMGACGEVRRKVSTRRVGTKAHPFCLTGHPGRL